MTYEITYSERSIQIFNTIDPKKIDIVKELIEKKGKVFFWNLNDPEYWARKMKEGGVDRLILEKDRLREDILGLLSKEWSHKDILCHYVFPRSGGQFGMYQPKDGQLIIKAELRPNLGWEAMDWASPEDVIDLNSFALEIDDLIIWRGGIELEARTIACRRISPYHDFLRHEGLF